MNVLGRGHCHGRPVLSAKSCLPNYEFLQPGEGVIFSELIFRMVGGMGGGCCDTLCVWSQLGSNESLLAHWCQHFGRKYWQLRQYIFCNVGTGLPDCAVSEHRRLNTLFLTGIRSHINVVNLILLHFALLSPPPSQTCSAILQFYQAALPIAFSCQNFNNISFISHECCLFVTALST